MERMGHSSSRVALIYQHATRDRDQANAKAMSEAMGEMFAAARKQARSKGRSGTQVPSGS